MVKTINVVYVWRALLELGNKLTAKAIISAIAKSLKWYEWIASGVLIATEIAAKFLSAGASQAINVALTTYTIIDLIAKVIIFTQNCFDWPIPWESVPFEPPCSCWDPVGNRGLCNTSCIDGVELDVPNDSCPTIDPICCFSLGVPSCIASTGHLGKCKNDEDRCSSLGPTHAWV